jgi:hypothetical protein
MRKKSRLACWRRLMPVQGKTKVDLPKAQAKPVGSAEKSAEKSAAKLGESALGEVGSGEIAPDEIAPEEMKPEEMKPEVAALDKQADETISG